MKMKTASQSILAFLTPVFIAIAVLLLAPMVGLTAPAGEIGLATNPAIVVPEGAAPPPDEANLAISSEPKSVGPLAAPPSPIPGFTILPMAYGPTPSAQIPLDRWLPHRFVISYTGAPTAVLGQRVDFQATASTSTSPTPTQELPAFPQPNRLYLSSNETQTIAIFMDEVWGQIKGQESPFPPGVITRTVRFNFSTPEGEMTELPVTYTITQLDDSVPITGTYLVMGTVVNSSGTPVSGANVSLDTGAGGYARTSTTGGDGSFSFWVPPHSKWALTASKSGHAPAYQFVGTTSPTPSPVSTTLVLSTSAGLSVQATEAITVVTPIGFWRGVVNPGETRVLLTNGMENWSDSSLISQSKLYLYDGNGTQLWTHDMGWQSWGADLSDDGTRAAFAQERNAGGQEEQGIVRVLDASTNPPTPLWTKAYTDTVFQTTTGDLTVSKEVRFSHDRQRLAVGSGNGDVFVLTSTTGSLVWRYFTEGQVRKIVWSQDNQSLYVGSGDGRLYKLNANTGALIWSTPANIWSWPFTYGLALSPDGSKIAAGVKFGWLTVVNAETGAVEWTFDMDGTVSWLDWSPDGQYLAAGGGGAESTSLFRSDGTRVWRNGLYSQAGRFSQDGRFVMAQSGGRLVFYAMNGEQVGEKQTSINAQVGQFAYITNDGTRIVAAARDMTSGTVGISFLQVTTSTASTLSATKTASQSSIGANQRYSYTIAVANGGATSASVLVTDPLPGQVAYAGVATSTSGPVSYDSGSNQIRWNGDIAASGRVTVTFAVTSNAGLSAGQLVTNAAQIAGSGSIITASNVVTAGAPSFSQSVKMINKNSVAPGEVVTYTVRIANGGSADAANVVLTDNLPSGMTYVTTSVTSTAGTAYYYTGSPGQVRWFGPVGANENVTVTFRAQVSPQITTTTRITNYVTIDGDGVFGTGLAGTTVSSAPDLTSSWKDVNTGLVTPGSILTYSIVLANDGPGGATNARVTDVIPANTTYGGSATASSGSVTVTDGILTWSGGVSVGQPVTITFSAIVTNTVPNGTVITNTATIDDGTGRSLLSRSAFTAVSTMPDLTTSWKMASGQIGYGQTLTYTIRLENTGIAHATGARVTDAIPSGLSYVDGSAVATSGTVTQTGGFVIWNGPVNLGTPVTITFAAVVTAPNGSVITNTAWINDGAGGVFTKMTVTDVSSQPDLTFSAKMANPGTVNAGDVFTYAIRLANYGNATASGVRVTDSLPFGVAFAGRLTATAGAASYFTGTVGWNGSLAAGSAVTISFRVTATAGANTPITNTAQIDDGQGGTLLRSVQVYVAGSEPPPPPPGGGGGQEPPGGGGGGWGLSGPPQITGTVLSTAGQPVPEAQVEVRQSSEWSPPIGFVNTNASGEFGAGSLVTGTTYLFKASSNVTINEASSAWYSMVFNGYQRITLTLRTPQIAGVVRDPGNTIAISNTQVEMHSRDGMSHSWENVNANGAFAFAGLNPNTFFMKARAPMGTEWGDSLERQIVYSGAPVTGIVLNLTAPLITGTVTAPDNVTPVTQTFVSMHSRDFMVNSGSGTDDSGRFTIGTVPDGIYLVEAYPPFGGFGGSQSPYSKSLPRTITVTNGVALGASYPFTLALTAPSITGTVLSPNGAIPISNTHVQLHSLDWMVQSHSNTDNSGNFSFGGVDPGIYVMEADAPWDSSYARSLPRTISVTSGTTRYYTITLTSPSLTGVTVKVSGTQTVPVPFAGVDVRMRDNTAFSSFAGSDQNGQFGFGGLAPGVYWLSAHTPWEATGLVAPASRLVTITEGSTLSETLVFERASKHIAGQVVRSNGGVVTDAMVFANRDNGAGWANDTVNNQGRFRMDVGPGAWMVMVGPAMGGGPGDRFSYEPPNWTYGRPPSRVEFPDSAGEITRTLIFTVTDASSRITGRLQKPDGNPPAQAGVGFHSVAGFGSGGPVQQDGSFSISLPPGTYMFDVWLPDDTLTAPRRDPIVLGEGQQLDMETIVLGTRNSLIVGTVVDTTGRGVSGLEVGAWMRQKAIGPDGGPGGPGPGGPGGWARTTSITDGVFSLYVVSGTWEAHVMPEPGSRYVPNGAPVQVNVGDNVTVTGVSLVVSSADAEISGSVVDDGGNPLTDIYGFAFVTTGSGPGPGGYGAPINGGTFTIRLPAGTYTVEGGLPPGSEYTLGRVTGVNVSSSGSTTVTVTATQANAVIAGTLVDSSGTTRTNLRANVFASGSQGNSFTQIEPDTGQYRMRVAPGSWFMNGFLDPSSGYSMDLSGDAQVTATNGVTVTYNFTVTTADSSIWGLVTDPNGSAVGGAWVEARPSSGPGRNRPPNGSDTNSSGIFTITVPSGTYELMAFLPPDRGYLPPAPVTVTVSSGAVSRTLAFRSPGATISGTVTLSNTAVSSGLVRGFSAGGSRAYTDISSSGTYSIPVISNDTWYIQAVRELTGTLYESPMYTVTVGTGASVQNIVLGTAGTTMPDATSVSFDSTAMRLITLGDGTEINIPAGALAVSGTVTVRAMPNGTVAMDSEARPIGLAYDLLAMDSTGATITSFRQNVAVILHYTEAQLAALGISEDQVMGSYWDSASGSWRRVSNMVQDRTANTLNIYTRHFSSWTITGGGTSTQEGTDLSTSTKTSSQGYVKAGERFNYTVTLVNSSGNNASVVMTDPLPSQVTYVPTSVNSGSGLAYYDTGTNQIRWSGTVTGSQSVTVTFGVTLNGNIAVGQRVTNSATIDAGSFITANNVITSGVRDLAQSVKSVSNSTAAPGDAITFTVRLNNSGMIDATNARMTDTIPSGTTLVTTTLSATSGSATFDPIPGKILWNGAVPSGQAVTVTFQTRLNPVLPAFSTITNTADIDDGAGVVTNKSAYFTVLSAPNLATSTKSVNPSGIVPGGVVTYSIYLRNAGTDNAANVRVTDSLPNQTFYVNDSASATAGTVTVTQGVLRWNGGVNVGQPVTITFRANIINPLANNSIVTNTATIDDGNGNVFDRYAASVVTSSPFLGTSVKSGSSVTVAAGSPLTYTIRLANTGTENAAAARMTDAIPSYVSYVGGSVTATAGSPGFNGTAVTWNGALVVGSPVTVTFQVNANSPITNNTGIANFAVIDDGRGSLITRTETSLIVSGPNLAGSQKLANPDTVTAGEVFTYAVRLVNTGTENAASVNVTDTLPPGVGFVGALNATSGSASQDNGVVTWNGAVLVGTPVTISFRVSTTSMVGNSVITNTAEIDDGHGTTWFRSRGMFVSGGQQPPGPTPGASQVTGVVLSSGGITVPNASVEVRAWSEWSPPTAFVTADSTGEFGVSGLMTGTTYVLKASPSVTSTDASSDWYSLPFTGTTRITLTLRTPSISGIVRDPSNTFVISNTNVELQRRDTMMNSFENVKQNGAFAFGGLGLNTYKIKARAPMGSSFGDSLEREIVYTGTPITGLVINLTAPFLTGTVTAPDNVTPISRTFVSMHSRDFMVNSGTGTDDSGRFTLGGVPDGVYLVEAFPPFGGESPYSKSLPRTITVTNGVALGASQPFTLALTAPSITGTVLSPDGSVPISNTHIQLHSADWMMQSHSQTNDTGNFSFGGVDPGTYILEADPPANSTYSRSAPRTVTVTGSSTRYYTITLTSPSLTGVTVKVSGTQTVAVPFAGVDVRMQDNPAVASFTGADFNGQFSIGGLGPGVYWLNAHTPWDATGLVAPASQLVTITSGSSLSVTLVFESATKHIAGQVVRSSGGVVTDAMVFANKENGAGWANTRVDEQGRYRLDVGPGAWMVMVGPSMGGPGGGFASEQPNWTYGRPPSRIDLPSTAGEITKTLNFTVTDASSRIYGTLRKPDSNPPSQAGVGFHTTAGFGSGGPVDQQGNFSVQLPPGSYIMDVWLPDTTLSAPRTDPVVLAEGEQKNLGTITLGTRNSVIQGAVVDTAGRGVSGIQIGAWMRQSAVGGPGGPGGPGPGGWANTTSITDGVFSLYVVSGTWEAHVMPEPGSRYVPNGPPTQVSVGENVTVTGVSLVVSSADAEISGSVVDGSGNPLSDIYGFAFVMAGGTGAPSGYGAPINAGTFTIRLPAGTYTVEGGLPPGSSYILGRATNVNVASSGTTTVTLTATQASAVIAGSLVNSSGVVQTGLRANVLAGGPEGHSFTQVDPDNGQYRMLVGPGQWFMNAHLDPTTGSAIEPVTNNLVTTTNSITVTYNFTVASADSRIWGLVTVPPTTSVAAGAWVEARPTGGAARNRPPYGAEANASGLYTITVPAGTYELMAFLPPDRGYMPPAPVTVTVSSGSRPTRAPVQPRQVERRDLAFRSPGATISGTVTLSNTAVSSGLVRGYSAGGARAYTTISSNGTYSIPVVSNDTWYIQAVQELTGTLYESTMYTVTVGTGTAVQNIALRTSGTTLPDATSVSFDASAMRLITLGDGTEISIPAGALAVSGTVTVRAMPNGTVAMDSNARPIGLAYDLLALDSTGATITSFRQNVAIILHYTEAQLAALGITEDQVMGSYWDTASGSWRQVSNMVQDRSANTLTIYTDHYSSWSVTGGGGSAPTSEPNLSGSTKTASQADVAAGESYTYTIVLANTGTGNATAMMTDPLPSEVTYVPSSVNASSGTGSYDSGTSQVRWSGTVTTSQSVTVSFAVTLSTGVSAGQRITNSATIIDGVGTTITASNAITVSSAVSTTPNLSTSSKSVSSSTVAPGGVLTYTIRLVNGGTANATGAVATDTLPSSLTYVTGSGSSTWGSAPVHSGGTITWSGTVSASTVVTLSFSTQVSSGATVGSGITNTVSINDGTGTVTTKSASSTVVTTTYKLYLPIVTRSATTSFGR